MTQERPRVPCGASTHPSEQLQLLTVRLEAMQALRNSDHIVGPLWQLSTYRAGGVTSAR